jgi:prepilin-type N-terminal cleavage/methylation domain-containing protein
MKRGFTLIEVLVTMTIVAILAGMMVPAVWKVWENQEIQTTKDRMNALKLAMVGDRSLIQNGIRTSYGYVGDHGDIPVLDQLSSVKHYMPADFDRTSYMKDAWGNDFTYTLDPAAGIAARLSSGGINGTTITLEISEKEVKPTITSITGRLIVYSSATWPYKNKHFKIKSQSPGWVAPSCIAPASCPGPAPLTCTVSPLADVTLPIGPRQIFWCYYSNSSDCTSDTNPICQSTDIRTSYYIHDGMSTLSYSLIAP